jgi:hypothetical protein
MPDELFPLGRIVMTTNLQRKLQETSPDVWEEELQGIITRHASGDWGDLGEEDKRENELSVRQGFRIFSAYTTSSGIRGWVITEADRSCTTALLPDDY